MGTFLLGIVLLLMLGQLLLRLIDPKSTPSGVTTLLLSIGFFGAIDLFALALIGEYVAKIFEEVKQRPLFIRRSVIKDGEIRPASETSAAD
jgi:dolichol-phosphate mannosyltransferase